mgnify:CR=1 FL=1
MNIFIVIVCLATMKIAGMNMPEKFKDYLRQHLLVLSIKSLLTFSTIFLFIKLYQPENIAVYIISGITVFILFHFYEGFSMQRMFLNNGKSNG